MSKFTDYLKHLRSSGKSYFSLEEAMKNLGVSKDAVLSVVYRLKKKGDLISPAKLTPP